MEWTLRQEIVTVAQFFQPKKNRGNSVMRCMKLKNADMVCLKTRESQVICGTQSPHLEDDCAYFASHTFVPISRMCKMQSAGCHNSAQAEIISLDAGLRMDGVPAPSILGMCVGNILQ